MRKFRFKFEPVLTLRKRREEEALRALASAQRSHQAELARRAALVEALEQSLERREQIGESAVSPEAFRLEQDFITGTKQRIVHADQAISRASRGVEKALRIYLGARRQTRTIEVLRQKDYEEFRRELAKGRQRELDDLIVMRERLKEEIA